MKLNNLLEEVKLGTEFYNETKSSDEIISLIDPDLHFFYTSKRIAQLKEGLTEDSETLLVVDKLEKSFSSIEEKIIANSFNSAMSKKIKLYEVVENYNKLVDKFSNKKFHNSVNTDKFARIFATVQFGINQLVEDISVNYTIKDVPSLLEDVASSELNLINEIVN